MIAGRTLDIDTTYMFKNALNAVMPKDTIEFLELDCKRYQLVHLDTKYIKEVQDDIRFLFMKCQYCGDLNPIDDIVDNTCIYCKEQGYLESLV